MTIKKDSLQWIEFQDAGTEEIVNFGLLRMIETANETQYAIVVDEELFDELLEEYDQEFEVLRYEKDNDGNDIFIYLDTFEDAEIEEFEMVLELLEDKWNEEYGYYEGEEEN
jgi:Zn-dependent metalloprotease